jgi:HK97 family phage major capsid protein
MEKENAKVIDKDSLQEALKSSNEEVMTEIKNLNEEINKIKVTPSQKEEDLKKKGGFETFNELLKTYMSSPGDSRIKQLNTQVSSEGGILIPEAFASGIWSKSIEQDQIYDRVMRMPTDSNNLSFRTLKDDDHSSNIYGGIKTYYTEEEDQLTSSKPAFGKVSFKLNKLAALAYVTNEMIEDSPVSLEPYLMQKFSDAIRWRRNKDILVGTGANQPLGILSSPALVTISEETSQSADTIEPENLFKMYARTQGKGNGVWIANHDTLPELAGMTLGGNNALVYMPPNGMADAPYGTILGRPVIFTEHAKTIGDKGDIIFADLSQYGVLEKSNGIKTAVSMHLKFDYDMMAFRITYRWDGQPMTNTAFTPANGSDMSPFTVIEARTG